MAKKLKYILSSLRRNKILPQFIKYAVIGILTNTVGYVAYLILTGYEFSPKSTITVLYGTGAMINFFANRRYTFEYSGHLGGAGFRYILVQLAGYLMNLLILVMFVDWLKFTHQYVQAAAVLVVAIFLFLLSRFFIFTPDKSIRKDEP